MRIARNTIRSRDRPLGCTTLVLETHSLSWLSAPSPIVPTTSKRRLPTDLVGQAFYQGVATAAVSLALFGSSTMLLGPIERRRLVALASLMERGLLSYSCLFSIGPTSESRKNRPSENSGSPQGVILCTVQLRYRATPKHFQQRPAILAE